MPTSCDVRAVMRRHLLGRCKIEAPLFILGTDRAHLGAASYGFIEDLGWHVPRLGIERDYGAEHGVSPTPSVYVPPSGGFASRPPSVA